MAILQQLLSLFDHDSVSNAINALPEFNLEQNNIEWHLDVSFIKANDSITRRATSGAENVLAPSCIPN